MRDIVTNGGSSGPSTFTCGISATFTPSGRIMSITACAKAIAAVIPAGPPPTISTRFTG
jgi:hypothetical protein